MIILVILALMLAIPWTFFMILYVAQGVVEAIRYQPPEPPPKLAPPEPGPEWWWRWQRTEQWHQARHSPPPLAKLPEQPIPKKGRAVAKTWEQLGHKTGVINLETGEIYEPADKGEDG